MTTYMIDPDIVECYCEDELYEKEGVQEKDETILEEAERLTCSKRMDDYGPYADNANKAVDIYFLLKGNKAVTNAADVALFQFCHKLGREFCKHKRDNLVDACGYLKLYYQEITKEIKE